MKDETPAFASYSEFENQIREALSDIAIRCFRSTGSTNDEAVRALRDGSLPLPSLFAAWEQTAGRGRRGRRWSSALGAATFSLVVPDPLGGRDARRGWVPLLMANAVCEALAATTGVSAAIKWPNDVMLNDRKVAGLLVEAIPPEGLVIGCGINVRNPSPLTTSISLRDAVNDPPQPAELIVVATRQMLQHLNQLTERCRQLVSSDNKHSSVAVEFLPRQRDWLRDRCIEVTSSAGNVTGRAAGFSEFGALRIQDDINGTVTDVVSGTVRVLTDFNTADSSCKTD